MKSRTINRIPKIWTSHSICILITVWFCGNLWIIKTLLHWIVLQLIICGSYMSTVNTCTSCQSQNLDCISLWRLLSPCCLASSYLLPTSYVLVYSYSGPSLTHVWRSQAASERLEANLWGIHFESPTFLSDTYG